MPELISNELNVLTADIAVAYLKSNRVQPGEMPVLLAAVHGALSEIGRPATSPEAIAKWPKPVVPIKKTVADDFIVSLEDGKRYKMLKRHLAKCGLTPDQYRAKWSLPADYPMAAPAYTRASSDRAKDKGFGSFYRKR